MNISEIAFKYQKLMFLIIGLLLTSGIISYFTLPAQEDPTITIREALVTTEYPGMSTVRVEQLITKKLEESIRKIPEIKEIRSTSITGKSIIHVSILDQYFNLDNIWQDLRNNVNDAFSNLPDGTIRPVVNDEFGDVAVITVALTADGFSMHDMHNMAKHIRDLLYAVKGTKKIDMLGIQQERIFLETNTAKLAQVGITPKELARHLEQQNIVRSGGMVDTGAKSFVIEPSGNFESVEEIADTLINIPNTDKVVAIKDIVDIRRGYIDPPHQPAYYNGTPAIVFAIAMLDGYNVLEFSPRVKKELDNIRQTLPVGYNLDIATYQAEQVEKTIRSVSNNVLQTLIIVLAVVISFLGFRAGVIVGAIVPFVMLATLAIMNILEIDLERMSLATLIISLGLLVDNGIVIAEDYKRRLEQKLSREEALKQSCQELAFPLLSSSLTTILFFLPLMLADHAAGEYTRSISLVIAITLLVSWFMALCLTPTLCYYFVKIKPKKERNKPGRFDGIVNNTYAGYEKFLKLILRFRFSFLAVIVGLFIFSVKASEWVPKRFFPDSDREQVLIYAELPAGVSSRITDQEIKRVFKMLDEKETFPHIMSYAGYIGFGGPRFVLSLAPEDPADNNAFIVANIDNIENQDKTIHDIEREVAKRFPHIFFRVKKMFLGSSDSSEIEVQVKGPDADVIYAKAQQIVDVLHSIPNTVDIRTDWQNRVITVRVNVDQKRARRTGVSSEDIANSLKMYFSGEVITEFREDDNIIPITLRAQSYDRYNIDRLRTINVFSSQNKMNVPLMQIADFEGVNEYSRIEREDLFKTITITARNKLTTSEDLKNLIDPSIIELRKDLPINHVIEYDGVIGDSSDAQDALSANIPLAFVLMIGLLVAQFNSYRCTIMIIITIPLLFIGTVFGLLVTNSEFGFMVTLGIYSLAGIIINNAIVMIDRIELERKSTGKIYESILNACKMRLRPIAMTTITTVFGLLPLILGQDPLFYGMANAIAFGLGIGTILTLGVVPVLYSVFFDIKNKQQ